MRFFENVRWPEVGAVDRGGLSEKRGREMRSERKREAERRRDVSAEETGSENPDRDPHSGAGYGADRLPVRGIEVRHELEDVLRKGVGVARERAPERAGGCAVPARGASQAQIDASRKQRFERAEPFRHHERRMVRKHDAAGPDADPLRRSRDVSDQNRRRCAGDPRHVVMLREPEALATPPFRPLREIECVAKRGAGVAALDDRSEIQDRERNHRIPHREEHRRDAGETRTAEPPECVKRDGAVKVMDDGSR